MSDTPEHRINHAHGAHKLPIGSIVTGLNGTATRWRKTAQGVLIKMREPNSEGQAE